MKRRIFKLLLFAVIHQQSSRYLWEISKVSSQNAQINKFGNLQNLIIVNLMPHSVENLNRMI